MIEIDKNVPPPTDTGGRPRKYPWREMEVGDSFLIPGKAIRQTGGLRPPKDLNCRFSARTVEGGVRIWRIE